MVQSQTQQIGMERERQNRREWNETRVVGGRGWWGEERGEAEMVRSQTRQKGHHQRRCGGDIVT